MYSIISVSQQALKQLLYFLVAPAHVTISGPTEARVGDTVPLTCVTAGSNPPAEIKWLIGIYCLELKLLTLLNPILFYLSVLSFHNFLSPLSGKSTLSDSILYLFQQFPSWSTSPALTLIFDHFNYLRKSCSRHLLYLNTY